MRGASRETAFSTRLASSKSAASRHARASPMPGLPIHSRTVSAFRATTPYLRISRSATLRTFSRRVPVPRITASSSTWESPLAPPCIIFSRGLTPLGRSLTFSSLRPSGSVSRGALAQDADAPPFDAQPVLEEEPHGARVGDVLLDQDPPRERLGR